MMNKVAKLVVNFVLIAILIVGITVGNVIIFRYENEVSSLLTPPIVDNEAVETSARSGQEMSKRIMEEGAVLLKNEDKTLPLDRNTDTKVNVFGWRSIDWIYGSEGQNASGGVAPEDNDFEKNVDIYKALNAYGVQYNRRLYDMYYNFKKPDHQSANLRGTHINNLTPLRDPKIDDSAYYSNDLLTYSKDYSDTAIVVVGRMAGEAMSNDHMKVQRKAGPGAKDDNTRHYLEISTEEEALLTYCGANFEKVIVLLNVSNVFECGFLKTIPGVDACMYIGFTGTRGASALPSLLYGDVSPSGKTVDTFAYDLFTNPGNVFLDNTYTDNGKDYMDIVEDVYIGYKWYETADVMGVWDTVNNDYGTGFSGTVQFPFGHGLSYNDFSWKVKEFSLAPGSDIDAKTKISISVTVKNNGSYPGRDVVEAFVTAPYTAGGIEKSSVALVACTKTGVLAPGAEETVMLEADAYDFASYDCYDKNKNGFKGWELESGAYTVKLMTDSHSIKTVSYEGQEQPAVFDFNVKETIKIDKDPVTEAKVGNLFTGDDAVDVTPIDANDNGFTADIPWFSRAAFAKPEAWAGMFKKRAITPSAKYDSKYNQAKATAWDNATVDEFGKAVDARPVTWEAGSGKKLTDNKGNITQLGQTLGKDYDSPEWEAVLDQLSVSEITNMINNYYGSKAMDSVGKPWLTDFDGPAQIKGFTEAPRGTGFPTMVVIAQTWNPRLAYDFGKAYGDDMVALGVNGVWGWAMDLHRTAFFGRNHESPSEDSQLAGIIVTNAVKGLHTRGRYSFLKHFALYGFGGTDVWISEQGLRENYLKSFRMAFVEGGALGAMTTYQGIGAEHSETTVALLQGVLRNEWKFNGAITTDYIGERSWCDSIIRCGGNLGMGVGLSIGSYDKNSPVRLQRRLRESAHQVLYMWLHSDYNYRQYIANPDKNDTVIISNTIKSWSWWQPLVYTLDVTVGVGCLLWAGLVLIGIYMPSNKKPIESEIEGGKQ